MPELADILVKSLKTLRQELRIFLPKLASTSIGAAWFIAVMAGPKTVEALAAYAASGFFVSLIGVFVSVMLASMVKRKDEREVLRQGFLDALGRWKQLLAFMLLLTVFASFLYVPVFLGVFAYFLTREIIFVAAGGLFSVLFLLVAGFLLYFFPISLLEKGSILEGFKDSAATSRKNWKEVSLLTAFSLALLVAASLTGDTGMKLFGYTGFFLLRILSGIVTTYIFVVSPEYYLSE